LFCNSHSTGSDKKLLTWPLTIVSPNSS